MTRAVRVKECRAVISSAHRTEGIERGPAGWATGDRGHRSKRKSEKRTLNEALARREDGERKTARARERERERENEKARGTESGGRSELLSTKDLSRRARREREPREGPINN